MSDRRPNHDRITRGVPFGNQPAEDPCPGPVDAREWTPEPHEVYPAGQWECVSIMSGNKADGHGGAYRAWVHETYKARLHMSKYQESSVVTRF